MGLHVVEDEESFRETLQVGESAQVDLGRERVWGTVEQKMIHFKVAEQMKVAITGLLLSLLLLLLLDNTSIAFITFIPFF